MTAMSQDRASEDLAAPAETPAGMSQQSKLLIGLAVLVVAIIVIAALAQRQSGQGNGRGATQACENEARSLLASPATAKFSSEDATQSGNDWTVIGNVDAENGFGALIREGWSCTVIWDDQTTTWDAATVTGIA